MAHPSFGYNPLTGKFDLTSSGGGSFPGPVITGAVSATTTSLTALYNNGASGIGATLTNNGALAALVIDGVTVSVGNRVLIKDQTSFNYENGVYTVTVAGNGATAWVLTRATDFDQPSEITPGTFVPVTSGSTNINTIWIQTATVAAVGTDPIIFNKFSNAPITTTEFSLLVGGASNTVDSLPHGNNGQILQSKGPITDPNWTTATYPTTTSISQLLYSSANNVVSSLPTDDDGILVTSHTGVPSILGGPGSTGNILQSNATAPPSFSTAAYPATAATTGSLLYADGIDWIPTTATYPPSTTVNQILYSSSNDVVGEITASIDGVLVTDHTGVPFLLPNGTASYVLTANANLPPSWQPAASGSVSSVSGTLNRISSTGGANPVIDIDAAYVGQTSITTLGTVSTGTWTATTIAADHGGTGTVTNTLHGVLIGQGASAVAATSAGSTGQLLQSKGASTDPNWTTATYPATATGTGTLLRADGTNWAATTATYPSTATVSQLLYASATNVISGLSTANNGTLVTSNTGVPSILAGPGSTGNVLQSNAAAAPSFSTATYPSVATGTGKLLRADGTNWSASTATYPDTAGSIGNVLTSDGTNWISSPASSGGTPWSIITADQTAAINNAYICNKAGLLTLTLPGTAAVGSVIGVMNHNTALGTKILSANPGQIYLGDSNTTADTGHIDSIALGDSLFLVCVVANTTWRAYGVEGNWTIV